MQYLYYSIIRRWVFKLYVCTRMSWCNIIHTRGDIAESCVTVLYNYIIASQPHTIVPSNILYSHPIANSESAPFIHKICYSANDIMAAALSPAAINHGYRIGNWLVHACMDACYCMADNFRGVLILFLSWSTWQPQKFHRWNLMSTQVLAHMEAIMWLNHCGIMATSLVASMC